MKYIKLYEEYKNTILGKSSQEEGWRILQLSSYEELENYMNKWVDENSWVSKDGDWDVYYNDDKQWDEEEGEFFWHTKLAILIDKKRFIIKTKEILSEPLYKIRDEENGMNRNQELGVRMWAGTDKKPKFNKVQGQYLGMKDGFALVTSPTSGNIIKIDKEGNSIT